MQVLTTTQEIDLTAAFNDSKGNPAAVDGIPVWSSSDESVVTVVAAADGLSAVAKAAGKIGTAQVSVNADAERDAGVRNIVGVLDFDVQAAEAVTALIATGTPREQA